MIVSPHSSLNSIGSRRVAPRFARWLLAIGLILVCPDPCFATMDENLDRLLSSCTENRLFTGSVLVAKDGEVIYNKSFGTVDFTSGEAIGPNHALRLASVGKAFTAMTIMILEEAGKLSYEDDVKKHLADFPYDGVTIRHLLNHTSGLPDYVTLMDEHWDVARKDSPERKFATSGDALESFITYRPPVQFDPGERYRYSNTGYIMLALVTESASGQPFDLFLRDRIFRPLDMTRTLQYSPIKHPPIEHRVYGFQISPDGCETNSTEHHYLNGMYGDGEIYTTTLDMFKWDQALYTDKLVSAMTLNEAFSPARLNNGSLSDYGFGWSLSSDDEGRKVVSHGGGWVGFSTEFVREIEASRVTVILATGSQARFWNIKKAVADIVHEREFEIPGIPVSWQVGAAMRDGGITAAEARYYEQRDGVADVDDYYEYRLSGLGRYYLEKREFEKAISMYKLDVESFPTSTRTHNALGKAYLRCGEKVLAASCFENSLLLDSRDWNEAHDLLKVVSK
jgi:CubicO group peptidase (beta-lactamase class C family)